MKEDDGPRLHLGGNPLGDLTGRKVLPVQTVHVPLDGFHAQGTDGGDDLVVVLTVGGPEEGGPDPGDRLDLVGAGGDVGLDLLPAEL